MAVPPRDQPDAGATEADLITLGRRIRHARKASGLTLGALGERVGRASSLLSQIENGKREPRLALLHAIGRELGVSAVELMRNEPPSHRAALEIALTRAQSQPLYTSLGLPEVRTANLTTDVLEALTGLHAELERRATEQSATPEEARRANAELRQHMRARDNYFAEIEHVVSGISATIGRGEGPLTERGINELAGHLGFSLCRVPDLPRATRSITDMRNHRVYLPVAERDGHDPRYLVLQTLGHVALDHTEPSDYADFLRQRVEANYFAAAVLMPEQPAVRFLQEAKAQKDLAIEDLRDAFAVSYETAAHRFTNLATHHLGLSVHFLRVGEDGVGYTAYESDDVNLPADVTGAIEGQLVCRYWAARAVFAAADRYSTHPQYTDMDRGTYWCTTHVERTPEGDFAIDVGVPYAQVKWFRGRETTVRAHSRCPDPACCRRPPAELAAQWENYAWPSARAHSHLLAALPPGTFPGVDDTDVYQFLEKHSTGQV